MSLEYSTSLFFKKTTPGSSELNYQGLKREDFTWIYFLISPVFFYTLTDPFSKLENTAILN
jgi:hypothetical protein